MKKLLIILLVPIIGFGQDDCGEKPIYTGNKFGNYKFSPQYKKYKKNLSKWSNCNKKYGKSSNKYFLDDYKILKDTSFSQILKKCEKYNFNVLRNDRGSMIHSKTGFDKYILLEKNDRNNRKYWCKFIHIDNYEGLDDNSGDLNDFTIWKVETYVMTMTKYKKDLEKYIDNFHKSIVEHSYNQHYGSKVVYNHKDRVFFASKGLVYNVVEVENHSNKLGEKINIGMGLAEDGDFSHLYLLTESENEMTEFNNTTDYTAQEITNNWANKKSKKSLKIPIIKEADMNYISINIGGKNYKYLIDTGASDMVINTEMKDYLMQVGILKSSDFGQSKIYEIANGNKVRFKTATLNSIEISGNTFNNIPIAIGDNASLLLGMSFLDKFHWRINNNTLELERK